MKFIILLASFLPFLLSCNHNKQADKTGQLKFDKTKWRTMEADAYPYRDDMLEDLINNVKLKGLKYDSARVLLGEPDRIDSGHLFYRIYQKRIGVFPLTTKTFVIKLATDSTVEWRKIHGG